MRKTVIIACVYLVILAILSAWIFCGCDAECLSAAATGMEETTSEPDHTPAAAPETTLAETAAAAESGFDEISLVDCVLSIHFDLFDVFRRAPLSFQELVNEEKADSYHTGHIKITGEQLKENELLVTLLDHLNAAGKDNLPTTQATTSDYQYTVWNPLVYYVLSTQKGETLFDAALGWSNRIELSDELALWESVYYNGTAIPYDDLFYLAVAPYLPESWPSPDFTNNNVEEKLKANGTGSFFRDLPIESCTLELSCVKMNNRPAPVTFQELLNASELDEETRKRAEITYLTVPGETLCKNVRFLSMLYYLDMYSLTPGALAWDESDPSNSAAFTGWPVSCMILKSRDGDHLIEIVQEYNRTSEIASTLIYCNGVEMECTRYNRVLLDCFEEYMQGNHKYPIIESAGAIGDDSTARGNGGGSPRENGDGSPETQGDGP